jgi:hypothetical protein
MGARLYERIIVVKLFGWQGMSMFKKVSAACPFWLLTHHVQKSFQN